jgi:hypothetical protein
MASLHLDCAQRRMPAMIKILARGAKHSEDSVTNEVLNVTLLSQDHVDHRRQVFVEHFEHPVGRDPLAECSEPAEIGHDDRHLADLAPERCVLPKAGVATTASRPTCATCGPGWALTGPSSADESSRLV